MVTRIHIMYTVADGRAVEKHRHISNLPGGKTVSDISLVDVYTIEKQLSKPELTKIGTALSNTKTELFSIKQPLGPSRFSYAIEIGFLPGVTDNVGRTAKETVEDLLRKKFKSDEHVYSSRIYFLSGKLSKSDVEKIALELHNPLIQRSHIKAYAQYTKDKGMDVIVPTVKLTAGTVDEVDMMVTDEELTLLGKAGVPDADGTRRGPLGMGLDEIKSMRNYFHKKKRNPTDAEIETLAQTWSEHCKHTIFANPIDDITEGLYKRYIKGATEKIRRKKAKTISVYLYLPIILV